MTGNQATLNEASSVPARESRTSAPAPDEGDESIGPISPTLPSSTSSTSRSESLAGQSRKADSESGEREKAEFSDTPAMNSDDSKANLRNRTVGRRANAIDKMDMDD
jgi:hypothetical protein